MFFIVLLILLIVAFANPKATVDVIATLIGLAIILVVLGAVASCIVLVLS